MAGVQAAAHSAAAAPILAPNTQARGDSAPVELELGNETPGEWQDIEPQIPRFLIKTPFLWHATILPRRTALPRMRHLPLSSMTQLLAETLTAMTGNPVNRT